MDNVNICKFIPDRQNGSDLIVLNFVHEKNCNKLSPEVSYSYSIGIITKGNGKYTIDGTEYSVEKGDVFFYFPSKEYNFVSLDKLEYLFISFTGTRAAALKIRANVSPENAVIYGRQELISMWENAHKTADGKNIDLIAEGILLYTFAIASTTFEEEKTINKNDTDIVLQIKKYVERNVDDPTLCLKTVSEKFLYNDKYISEKFRKTMRINFTDYLRNLRIERAVVLLKSGSNNIGEVARLCGFTDQFYFSKVFKSVMGVSPKNYQKEVEK